MSPARTAAGVPKVSVITPCLNGIDFVDAMLESCVAQDYAGLEVLFVDNGSEDDSAVRASQLQASLPLDIKVLHCPQRGANHARLMGLAAARGEYIQFLDVDDQLQAGKIARQVAALQRLPECDVAYGDWRWHHQLHPGLEGDEAFAELIEKPQGSAFNSGRWRKVAHAHSAEQVFRLHEHGDHLLRVLECQWAPPHNYLWRRSFIDRLLQVQAIWPQRAVEQDREWMLFAALLGARFTHVAGSQVIYNAHSHAAQMSRRTDLETRRAANEHIFARLQALAASEGIALSPVHRRLLQQPWGWFELDKDACAEVTTAEPYRNERQWARLRSLARLREYTAPFYLEQIAVHIAYHERSLWGRHRIIMDALFGLLDEGLLREAAAPAAG